MKIQSGRRQSKYSKISYCDALSFVIITQLLDAMPCLTFDKDFRSLGLLVYPD
jgi:predicted nucleic acid-binding protein